MTARIPRDLAITATPALLIVFAVLSLVLAACAAPAEPGVAADPAAQPPAAGPAGVDGEAAQAAQPTAVVIKSPTCSCCGGHEEYLRQGGMAVTSVTQADMSNVKDHYGVPAAMRSCHTTDVAGYFVEGHVPLAAINQLLAERPDLDGIALPGMPAGAPGMGGELAGPLVVYGVRGGEVVGEFGSY